MLDEIMNFFSLSSIEHLASSIASLQARKYSLHQLVGLRRSFASGRPADNVNLLDIDKEEFKWKKKP
jgi:hypothetical protein